MAFSFQKSNFSKCLTSVFPDNRWHVFGGLCSSIRQTHHPPPPPPPSKNCNECSFAHGSSPCISTRIQRIIQKDEFVRWALSYSWNRIFNLVSLDNGAKMSLKSRPFLSLVFACICIKKKLKNWISLRKTETVDEYSVRRIFWGTKDTW